ncbi:CoA transferase, partial [Acinetobacter baumannii]
PRPAYDDLVQGAALVAGLYARATDGEPRYAPMAIADRIAGLMMANAINGALFWRERTGEGQLVEVPMFETMLTFVLGDHLTGRTFD